MGDQTVYQELTTATKVTPNQGEAGKDYYPRLIKAVSEVEESVWNGLSQPSQQWYNDAIDAIQQKKDIPEIPGGLPTGPTPVPTQEAAKPATRRGRKPTEAAATAAPSTPKPATPKVASNRGENGALWRVKEAILENPSENLEQLMARLVSKNITVSKNTLLVSRPDFLQSLRLLQKKGLLKDGVLPPLEVVAEQPPQQAQA